MNDQLLNDKPIIYEVLESKCAEIGFSMPSDLYIGTLLKTLIRSKPQSNVLELGTGIGLSLSWMIDGLDDRSTLTSIDNDPELITIAKDFFGHDPRVTLECTDGSTWISNYQGEPFDLIFADAWPGKYSELDETLALLKIGGFYVIDDMSAQPNWPDGHQDLVDQLIVQLEQREDLSLTKLNWSTGVIIAVRTL